MIDGIFDRLISMADATLDLTYAETFSFEPMRDIRNGTPVQDETRNPIAEVDGVFDDQGLILTLAGRITDVASAGPMISIRDVFLPQGARKPDRFTRHKTDTVYEVRAVTPDGLGRTVLTVVEVVQ